MVEGDKGGEDAGKSHASGAKKMKQRFKRIDFKTGRELKPGERPSRVKLRIPAIYKGTVPLMAPRPAALISDMVHPLHFFLPKIKGG